MLLWHSTSYSMSGCCCWTRLSPPLALPWSSIALLALAVPLASPEMPRFWITRGPHRIRFASPLTWSRPIKGCRRCAPPLGPRRGWRRTWEGGTWVHSRRGRRGQRGGGVRLGEEEGQDESIVNDARLKVWAKQDIGGLDVRVHDWRVALMEVEEVDGHVLRYLQAHRQMLHRYLQAHRQM